MIIIHSLNATTRSFDVVENARVTERANGGEVSAWRITKINVNAAIISDF